LNYTNIDGVEIPKPDVGASRLKLMDYIMELGKTVGNRPFNVYPKKSIISNTPMVMKYIMSLSHLYVMILRVKLKLIKKREEMPGFSFLKTCQRILAQEIKLILEDYKARWSKR